MNLNAFNLSRLQLVTIAFVCFGLGFVLALTLTGEVARGNAGSLDACVTLLNECSARCPNFFNATGLIG